MKDEKVVEAREEKPQKEPHLKYSFVYEGKTFHSEQERLTIREIKVLVGQELDVAIAEVVDGRQIERANDYVVDLAKGHSFKRVPEFVRG